MNKNGRIHGAKRFVESCEGKNPDGERELPKEEGDAVREYKAMREENFLSGWLREDERGKKKGRRKLVRKMKKRE